MVAANNEKSHSCEAVLASPVWLMKNHFFKKQARALAGYNLELHLWAKEVVLGLITVEISLLINGKKH